MRLDSSQLSFFGMNMSGYCFLINIKMENDAIKVYMSNNKNPMNCQIQKGCQIYSILNDSSLQKIDMIFLDSDSLDINRFHNYSIPIRVSEDQVDIHYYFYYYTTFFDCILHSIHHECILYPSMLTDRSIGNSEAICLQSYSHFSVSLSIEELEVFFFLILNQEP